jgi:hypothetical protein
VVSDLVDQGHTKSNFAHEDLDAIEKFICYSKDNFNGKPNKR